MCLKWVALSCINVTTGQCFRLVIIIIPTYKQTKHIFGQNNPIVTLAL